EGALVQPVATALRNRDSVAWRIRVTPEFSIHDVQQRARHTLVLAGDLEMTNAPILATVIARLCTDGASEIVLDLGELRFIDSTGLGSIVTGRAVCQEHGCEFGLTRGDRLIRHAIELTGLDEAVPRRAENDRPPGPRSQLWPVPTSGDQRPPRQVESPAVRVARLTR